MANLTVSANVDTLMGAPSFSAFRTSLGVGIGDSPVFVAASFTGSTTLTLGTAGSLVGSVAFKNATSGTATIAPPTGALGAYTVTLPNAASTLPIYPQQLTYTGPTAARTVTYPDASFTVARIDAANTFTGASTTTSWVETTPVITGGLTASGSGANTFAGSTGTFITSTGANTLSGAVTVNDATTPSLTTAAGKTNTGFLTVSGKTSGSLKITTADATGQVITVSPAAQTTGAVTLTTPDFAGVNDTFAFITKAQTFTNKTLDAPTLTNTTTAATINATTVNATVFNPVSDDGAPIGTTSLKWSDLFLASGAVVNFNSGNSTITHSAGLLTFNVPITLGASGTLGSVTMGNATSGTVKIQPVTGALGTQTLSLPAETGTLAVKGAQIRIAGFTADGAGSALSTGKRKGYFTCPIAGTITGWSIGVDTGTATVKVWKVATGTAVPTVSNNINTSGVAISSGTYVRSTTVTDFTSTAVAAGDIFAFNLSAVSGATEMTFEVEITPTN